MSDALPEFLTTRELAELLRIKERKVYDLVSSDTIPYSKATGKLLFSRREIDAWIASRHSGERAETARPAVLLGSHDPLLEWAVRESGADLALQLGGSGDGLDRFAAAQGQLSSLHIYEQDTDSWNQETVKTRFAQESVVLIEFAKRERGLIVDPGLSDSVHSLEDVSGRCLVPRPEGSGSQLLTEHLLHQAGLSLSDLKLSDVAHSETDAAIAVREGKADIAFGLQSLARQFRRGFVPLVTERLDFLVDRQSWFEAPIQTLVTFCRTHEFRQKAEEMGGYDISGFGQVHFNSGHH